jgi:hypothetical protein
MTFAMFLTMAYFAVFCFFYHFFEVVRFELEPKEFAINTVFNLGFLYFGFTAAKLVL